MTGAAPAPRTARTLAVFAVGLVVVFGAAFGTGRLVPPIDDAVTVPAAPAAPAEPSGHAPMSDGPHTG